MTKKAAMIFRKTSTGLVPSNGYTAQRFEQMALGSEYRVTAMTKRSYKQLGLYWSVLQEVVDASGDWATPEHLHHALMLNLGYHTEIKTLNGKTRTVRDSSAFDKMDHEQFKEYVNKAMARLTEYLGTDVLAHYAQLTGQNTDPNLLIPKGSDTGSASSQEPDSEAGNAPPKPPASQSNVEYGLGHLVGSHRELVIEYARKLYRCVDDMKRKQVQTFCSSGFAETNDDTRKATVKVEIFIRGITGKDKSGRTRAFDDLMAFLGLTELEFKEVV